MVLNGEWHVKSQEWKIASVKSRVTSKSDKLKVMSQEWPHNFDKSKEKRQKGQVNMKSKIEQVTGNQSRVLSHKFRFNHDKSRVIKQQGHGTKLSKSRFASQK